MKKFLFGLAAAMVLGALTSCATEVKIENNVDPVALAPADTELSVDFLGFNATAETMPGKYTSYQGSRRVEMNKVDNWKEFYDGTSLNHLGKELEEAGLCKDCSEKYFGDFSTEDLANYKSKNGSRFVTFINVNDFSSTYTEKDGNARNMITYGTSSLALGLTLNGMGLMTSIFSDDPFFDSFTRMGKICNGVGVGFDLAGIGLIVWGATRPVETTFYYTNEFQICTYDTKTKTFVDKRIVKIDNRTDTFKGSYSKSGSDAYNQIRMMYGTVAQNELENAYQSNLPSIIEEESK